MINQHYFLNLKYRQWLLLFQPSARNVNPGALSTKRNYGRKCAHMQQQGFAVLRIDSEDFSRISALIQFLDFMQGSLRYTMLMRFCQNVNMASSIFEKKTKTEIQFNCIFKSSFWSLRCKLFTSVFQSDGYKSLN